MVSVEQIVRLHDRKTREWHEADESKGAVRALEVRSDEAAEWLEKVMEQHRANFDLWHIEDEARRPGAPDAVIADVKRRIDRTNQIRNDRAEVLDWMLWTWLEARELPRPDVPLHSESPGLMIDRLSILSLKMYHTREEAERKDASKGHKDRNLERLGILGEQRTDLAGCLNDLWRETLAGTRRFKPYRQLKMYNDPALNPAIYKSGLEEKPR